MKNLIISQAKINKNRTKIYKILIFSIIFFSLLLSLYNLSPFSSVDEKMIANWIWEFHDNPFPVNQYPPLFLYLHFILSLLYKAIFLLFGILKTGYEFLNMGVGYNFMIEAGRIVSAIFGMLMLYYIYRIGKEFYNSSVAFASTLLIAFNGVFILHNHIFKSDILVSFLITVSLFFLLKFLNTTNKKDLFLSSFFFGLSFAAKYNVVVFFIVIIIALYMRRDKITIFQGAKTFVVGSFLGFIVSSPNWIVTPVGNIKKLLNVYNFNKGSVYIQDLSVFTIYSNFISDIVNQFGILLVVVLFCGIIISFFKKSEKDILLILFLLIYIIFFGFTGFYARRFLLPIYTVIALLIGKTIFIDLINFLPKKDKLRSYIKVFLFIPIILHATFDVSDNLMKFNMLNLESKFESTVKFREEHNLNDQKIIFASQFMTPKGNNDIRFRKSFKIKHFYLKRGKPDFVQLNSWALNKLADLKKVEKPTHINISEYRVFHRIERERIQDWDIDIGFYYKIPNEFRELEPTTLDLNLPKMYQTHSGNVFYPVQMYEKYPEFMKSKSGYCFTKIYSKREITGFNFSIFSLSKIPTLTVNINGVKKTIPASGIKGRVTNYHMNNISKKRMNYQSVFDIEIYPKNRLKKSKIPEYFVVFKPVFNKSVQKKNSYKINISDEMEIPSMLNRSEYPEWIVKFFKETSINLVLYNYVNTTWLEKSTSSESMFFNESNIFSLDPGNYILEVIGEPIVNGKTVIGRAMIQYDIFSTKGKISGSFDVKDINNTKYPIRIQSLGSPVFMKLRFKNFRESNFLLERASIKPDLINYLQKNYSD